MKSVHSVLVLTLCLAMSCNLPVASASPHSGTSSSYKSGFSSQKSNSARSKPAPPPAGRQSGPGAFGKAPGSPASAQPQRNSSSMTRDVDQSAARANALKTLDARRAAASPQPSLPPANDTVMRPQTSPVYQTPPPTYQGPVYQQPSNGLMHGVAGFHARPRDEPEQSAGVVSDREPRPVERPGEWSRRMARLTDAQSRRGQAARRRPGGRHAGPGRAPPAAPESSFGASVAALVCVAVAC
jgi:hypothetical protein